MKVRILGKVMVLSCSLVAGGAFAAGPYIGANYTQVQYDNDQYDTDTLKLDTAVVRAGFEFNDYLGVEARGGMGVSDDSKGILDFDLDHMYGAYLKLSAPLSETVHPYVVGGYSKMKGTVEAQGTVAGIDYSVNENEHYEGESYGAGLDFNLTDTFGANLEYMRYYDQDDEEISGISVGLRSAF